MATNLFRILDTLKDWPFPRRINPHYDEVSKESADWIRSFQKAFDRCLVAALVFPTQGRERYRSACDLMNLFFVIDEHTDVLDEASVQALADISMDALLNPTKPWPDGETVIGEMTRQFWSRTIRHATPISRARFEWSWSLYMASVVEQARDREGQRARTIEEYTAVRRLTIGAEPCYALAELELSLPQEAYDHPLIKQLRTDITDMLTLDNDLTSYNKEQASGDDLHNIVTIAMHENNQGLHEALEWLVLRHKERMEHALAIWPQALGLSFSRQVDGDLIPYIDHLMNSPRAYECWAF
ncbi:hypothetical protein V8D89_004740 [Ganoderma adspersum]